MIYFIGGKKQREFKYFEILEKIRKENVGISESFFDADLKENEKFLEKININSIFSSQELVVLKWKMSPILLTVIAAIAGIIIY